MSREGRGIRQRGGVRAGKDKMEQEGRDLEVLLDRIGSFLGGV